MFSGYIWHMFGWESVAAAIEGYGFGWTKSVTLYTTDVSGKVTGDISENYVAGYIEWNADRDPKTKGMLTLQGVSLQPYVDYVAPVIAMEREDGTVRSAHLGIFAVGMPSDAGDYTGTERTYELKDTTSLLLETILTKAQNVAAAADYGTAAATVITGAGLTLVNVPAIGVTSTVALTLAAGMTRFEAAKQLLQAGGKVGPYALSSGHITYRPPLRLEDLEPFATWTGDQIFGPIRRVPNDELFANVIVVTNDDPNSAPISQRAYNRDQESKGSTVRLGREKGRKVSVPTLKSNTEALALARRYVSEASSYYQTIQTTVEMDPTIGTDVCIILDYVEPDQEDGTPGIDYSGKWWVRTWRIGFDEDDGEMPVELNQIAEFGS